MTHRKSEKKRVRLPEGTFGYAAGESRRGMMQSETEEVESSSDDAELEVEGRLITVGQLRALIRAMVKARA